ncbi:MAG: hypothetical protein WC071_12590, partial [Victivallaceae bacterium]
MFLDKNIIAKLKIVETTVHHNLWNRFMGDDYILYDYAGLNGEVILPTSEECEANKPNALAWWTPIENGAFFNGIYILGLIKRYERNKTTEQKIEISKLISGLYKLQDANSTPGCILRGLGIDGKCH